MSFRAWARSYEITCTANRQSRESADRRSEFARSSFAAQTQAESRKRVCKAWRQQFSDFAAKRTSEKEPIESKVLDAILKSSATPYSSYVPAPRGILHGVHAVVKQAWLLVLLIITGRSQSPLWIAGGVLLLTILSLPPRLWKAQIKRLGLLAIFLFVTTALFADGLPAANQSRHVPNELEGLPTAAISDQAYKTVLFHFMFITVTKKSIQLAQSVSCLTFSALQSASLCLTTTPAEQLATGLKFWFAPFRLVVVFEEVRNLALGLAARNLQWKAMERGAGIQVSLKMLGRLFSNLLKQSSNIAIAMRARGFVGPNDHKIVFASDHGFEILPNLVAILTLSGLLYSTFM